MNYQSFLEYKDKILKENKNIINLAENNLYAYYINDIVYDYTGHVNNIVYRCHLAEDWLKYYNLNEDLKRVLGVSSGVRESLSILVQEFKNKKFIIPQDVYPFYQKTLNDNNVLFEEYKTLSFDMNNCFDFIDKNGDILLITDPIKPLGLSLPDEFYNNIRSWLLKDSNRIVIVDSVYLFGNKINEKLLNLFLETKQIILLFSLSKSWCLPNHFGITLFPQKLLYIREKYKNLKKDQFKLNLAYMALNNKTNFNEKLQEDLIRKKIKLEELLNIKFNNDNNVGYMFYLRENFNVLLNKNILSIPISVFGGSGEGVIVSSLGI